MIDDHPAYPEINVGNRLRRDILKKSIDLPDEYMPRIHLQIFLLLAIASTLGFRATAFGNAEEDLVLDSAGIEFFENRIRPLFIEHCISCHGGNPDRIRGGLIMTDSVSLMQGGDGGPVIVPGKPDLSPLYLAVTYANPELAMPPAGRLSDQEINDIRTWIEMGAPDPRVDNSLVDPIDADPWRDPNGKGREHWAYVAMKMETPPQVDDVDWPRNTLDTFILAKMEAEGIAPAPEADRRTLLRRVYFDLIGLPPTIEESQAFLNDESPGAYTRLIDRLLDSPHYGERWGRHWLDVARYSDSNGLDENTAFANAWKYRDWVVNAFNTDLPYDQFLTMQIAGDLLPEPSEREDAIDNLVATAFLALGPKVLAEPDKEKMVADIVDEQLDVMGKAFMAQTIGCARCHDHKFDPVPTSDYYALAGIFRSTRTMESLNTVARVRERPLGLRSEIIAIADHQARVLEAQENLDKARALRATEIQNRLTQRIEDTLLASHEISGLPDYREAENHNGSNLNTDFDRWGPGVGILHTINPGEIQYVEYTLHTEVAGGHVVRMRYASEDERPLTVVLNGVEVSDTFCRNGTGSYLPDGMQWDTLSFQLPVGTSILRLEREGSFPHIDRFVITSDIHERAHELELSRVAEDLGIELLVLRRWSEYLAWEPMFSVWREYAAIPHADWNTSAPKVHARLQKRFAGDTRPDTSGVGPREKTFARILLEGSPPTSLQHLAERIQTSILLVMGAWDALATFMPDATALPDKGQEAIRQALVGSSGLLGIDDELSIAVGSAYGAEIVRLESEVKELHDRTPADLDTGIVVEEGVIADMPIFIRGNHTTPREDPTPRGMLTVLSGVLAPPAVRNESSGRLELAKWMTHPDHPLTARTMVNRIWQWHFGRGLVETSSNFGLRGGRPTHSNLLDWLALTFIQNDWSIKDMHRLIMNSATYRMGRQINPHAMEVDPKNYLLWTRSPRRLEAEPIRDSVFAVGGSLDRTVGGSLLNTGNFGYVTNDQSASNETYVSPRRSLYMPIIRNDMYSFFSTFDYTDPSMSLAKRPSTVVAQQALFMMNSPLVASQSERIANAILAEADSFDQRLELVFKKLFARSPNEQERKRMNAFLVEVESASDNAYSIPWRVAQSSDMEMPQETISPRLHAWRSLCRVLLSSNEFIYID